MIIWAIKLRTVCQDNVYCVDSVAKIGPYLKECMKKIKKSNKYVACDYTVKWLAVDFAVIMKKDKKGDVTSSKFGNIYRHQVH